MDTEKAKRLWREKNASTAKAVSVSIDGVGTVYVKPLHVADVDGIADLAKDDVASYGRVMASMLCDENGVRFSQQEREEWAQILGDATWDDYLAFTRAAKGAAPGN